MHVLSCLPALPSVSSMGPVCRRCLPTHPTLFPPRTHARAGWPPFPMLVRIVETMMQPPHACRGNSATCVPCLSAPVSSFPRRLFFWFMALPRVPLYFVAMIVCPHPPWTGDAFRLTRLFDSPRIQQFCGSLVPTVNFLPSAAAWPSSMA